MGRSADALDYGRFQWLPAEGVDVAALRDAGIEVSAISDPFVLDIGGVTFDPLVSVPTPIIARAPSAGPDWHLVQFRGPIKSEWLDQLRADGIIPAQYVHPYSYVVWSDSAALARGTTREAVRWSGEFQTAFRVQPQQRAFGSGLRATMALISRHRDQK